MLINFLSHLLFRIVAVLESTSCVKFGVVDTSKILNSGRGRVNVVAISAVTDAAIQITVFAVWINQNVSQNLLKPFILLYNI